MKDQLPTSDSSELYVHDDAPVPKLLVCPFMMTYNLGVLPFRCNTTRPSEFSKRLSG